MSPGRGYRLELLLHIAAYVLPAAVVWGVLGVVFWPLGGIPLIAPLIAWAYALGFGIIETFAIPFQAPSVAWQVPARWVKGRPKAVQILTWGPLLGPGLVTKNPYAGMWLLPLLLILNHSLDIAIVVGVVIGVAHGSTHALGVLKNMGYMKMNCSHLIILGAQLRWRYVDGLALLLAAGALTAYALTLLSIPM